MMSVRWEYTLWRTFVTASGNIFVKKSFRLQRTYSSKGKKSTLHIINRCYITNPLNLLFSSYFVKNCFHHRHAAILFTIWNYGYWHCLALAYISLGSGYRYLAKGGLNNIHHVDQIVVILAIFSQYPQRMAMDSRKKKQHINHSFKPIGISNEVLPLLQAHSRMDFQILASEVSELRECTQQMFRFWYAFICILDFWE